VNQEITFRVDQVFEKKPPRGTPCAFRSKLCANVRVFLPKGLGRLEFDSEMHESILKRSHRLERCGKLVQTCAE